PSVNDLIHIVVDDERMYASRMEDVDGGQLTVAAPIGAGDVDIPALGSVLDVAWVDERSRYAMPVRLTGLTRHRPPAGSSRSRANRGSRTGACTSAAAAANRSSSPPRAWPIPAARSPARWWTSARRACAAGSR